jgi:hypothetical protein
LVNASVEKTLMIGAGRPAALAMPIVQPINAQAARLVLNAINQATEVERRSRGAARSCPRDIALITLRQ